MDKEKSIIEQFLEGGWVISLIGALGMLARILNSNVKHTIWDFVRKIVVAIIASIIAWFMLEQSQFTNFTKALIYGVVGVVSPEIIEGIILLIKKLFDRPQRIIDFLLRKE